MAFAECYGLLERRTKSGIIRTNRMLPLTLASLITFALPGQDCTYRANPDAFLDQQTRAARQVFERTNQAVARASRPGGGKKFDAVPASSLPPRSFIDEEIFGTLAAKNVPSAAMSTDEEFIRRVTLDLTGKLPTPAEIRAFVASDSTTKRDDAIDKLLNSAAYVDKWTMWWGDLLENCSFPGLFDRRQDGRNVYYNYIKDFVQKNRTLRDMAYELIAGNGNHFDSGVANFPMTARTSMGPSQDTYDQGLVKTATFFLGMAQYDCLLCHNGRGHLDQISSWGSHQTRMDAWKMAAHFSHLNFSSPNVASTDFYFYSLIVSERTTGTYDLNTTTGNRPARQPSGTIRNLTPEYRDTGATPKDANWRSALGGVVWQDPMFKTNFANRFWRELMGMGMVEPYDMLDPDRLDPDNPPGDPWTLQATHPVLLKKLAQAFADSDFNMKATLRLIVQSNAYQMSSRYDGPWTLDMVPLFARHYPRRLWAEEIHDIIVTGTGQFNNYTPTHQPATKWAMQLPEPGEPNNDGATANFLNTFLRGNRDSQRRSSSLSILQRLALMNDPFVVNRTKAAAPNLATLFKITDNGQAVEEIFLTFLGRKPTDAESQTIVAAAAAVNDRNAFLEDLVWACINKADFQFSY